MTALRKLRIVQLTTDVREHSADYLNPNVSVGAAPQALLEGFKSLDNVEVHVVSCAKHRMPSPDKLWDSVWFHSLHVPKIGWMRTGYQGCIRAVRRKLREVKPDLVHGQGTERDCALSALYSGFPNVVTIHGNHDELARLFRAKPFTFLWLAARLENHVLRRTAGVFCNSIYTQSLVAPRARRTWLVPNALREAFFSAPRPVTRHGPPILLNIGVITARKRQAELLQVAHRLREQGADFRFHFVGALYEGDPYGRLFGERLRSLQDSGHAVHVPPMPVEQLIATLDEAAALVHFPSEEAFGLVVAEALSRNLKLFGARLGGIVDICSGVEGVELLDAADWDGLANGIATWLRQGAPRLSDAAGTMRHRYHPAVIAQRHLEIYREVLNSPS